MSKPQCFFLSLLLCFSAMGQAQLPLTHVTAAPTITSFTANPTSITAGGSADLTGIFSNGSGVITPGNMTATSGNAVSVTPSDMTTYVLTVTNSAGVATAQTATAIVPPTVPAAPAWLSIRVGIGSVWLNWAASPGATSYNVYRWTTYGGPTVIATGITTTTYIDRALQGGTPYYYGVAAVNSAGTSPVSSKEKQQPLTRVTVAELEQVLTAAHDKSDATLARQLSGLELTERLSSARLLSWKTRLLGAKAREALAALADRSAFFDPPTAEIPADAPPDLTAQQQMIALADAYLEMTIPKLPHLFATRTTVSYEEVLPYDEQLKKGEFVVGSLRATGMASATVLYRNGYDFVDTEEEKRKLQKHDLADVAAGSGKKPELYDKGVDTIGAFGQILSAMIPVVASGDLTWSRWEQGEGGARAVFRYVVPEEDSYYEVGYCCLPEGNGTGVFQRIAGYHGEITINPAGGAILRLTVVADLQKELPVVRSDIMIEYGPVEIAGKAYTCPVRNISITRSRIVTHNAFHGPVKTFVPYRTMLEDVSFTNYHFFRAESRVLPGFTPSPEENSPGPASAHRPAAMPPASQ